MSHDRRPDRGRRFSGGPPRHGGQQPRHGGQQPRHEARESGERRTWTPRPSGGPARPHGDEGAMSVRLDPRRRDQLKRLAAEAEMRPGELVTRWIIERLDGQALNEPPAAQDGGTRQVLEALAERVAALESRLTELASSVASAEPSPRNVGQASATRGGDRRSRARSGGDREAAKPRRVALHDEIAAVIAERGPLPASEIAGLIARRERYQPPRSSRPIDATAVSARVSNPHYRHRFVRREGRIGLAEG